MPDSFRILIVDDNRNNLYTLNAVLARLPQIEIVEAASGEEALLRTLEHDVDLILLDVQMPGMDGFETARHLQMTERTRKIPVIFLTAVFKSEEFIQHGYNEGAVDYLTKPLDEHLLLARVKLYRSLLQRERKLNAAIEVLSQKEQALTAALNKAEDASRTKSTFLSNMSHELRTPLTAIIGLSHIMARSANLSEQEKKNLATINRSGNHLLSLINEVLADSSPGVELKPSVTLPLANMPASNPVERGHVVGLAVADRGKRILVAEDNEVGRYLLNELLTPLGFLVEVAEDGLQAVAKAGEFCPDVILMDWRMPKMNGLDATRQILAGRQGTKPKILMLSANVFAEQEREALAVGIHAFLKKPLQDEELFSALEAQLNIQFLREEEATSVLPPACVEELSAKDLDILPPAERKALADAVGQVNPVKLKQVFARIALLSPPLTLRLQAMIDAVRHRELLGLLTGE
jgi:CheY-like chemotaxis protein